MEICYQSAVEGLNYRRASVRLFDRHVVPWFTLFRPFFTAVGFPSKMYMSVLSTARRGRYVDGKTTEVIYATGLVLGWVEVLFKASNDRDRRTLRGLGQTSSSHPYADISLVER